ncbi:hypothetical protein BKA61DRAFT_656502 [Leptodontidium sp. MPI-SDFR-AT-0119]|nr:hypothetical protein BKA61DRAFT_656502 [Leptodontidium sp. MPI-SDFR-AT-0119]
MASLQVTAKPPSTPAPPATPAIPKPATQTATQKTARILKTALFSEIVHIKVGKELKDFGVHKDLICYHSPYFKAAFNSGFEEAKTGIMKLPETNTKVFELFVHWLYTQVLWSKDDDKEEKRTALETMMDLHLFADMIRAVSLMNQSITALRDLSDAGSVVPTQTFARVWKNTTENSPIRRLIIDWMIWEVNSDVFERNPNSFPHDLLLAAMTASRKAIRAFQHEHRSTIKKPLLIESNYHVSEDTKEAV